MHTIPDLFLNIEGFNDSIRKFVCHVVGITFQTIDKKLLSELLDGVEGKL
jgi:COP9 signalosome, subunit CSN8.